MPLKIPTVIVVAGLPGVGKSMLAQGLSEKLGGVRHVDIDGNVRTPIFGLPHPDSYTNPKFEEEGRTEMGFAYEGLIQIAVRGHLKLGRSVIVTATFSRPLARSNIMKVLADFPNAGLKVIWCTTSVPTEEEIAVIKRRLSERVFGVNYFGGCTTIEHYLADRERYPVMDMMHTERVDTITLSQERCLEIALKHVLS